MEEKKFTHYFSCLSPDLAPMLAVFPDLFRAVFPQHRQVGLALARCVHYLRPLTKRRDFMPKTDYADPETSFPRLEARIWTIDGNTQFVDLWLWKKAGGERLQVTKSQPTAGIDGAHNLISEFKIKYGAECDPDDITVQD